MPKKPQPTPEPETHPLPEIPTNPPKEEYRGPRPARPEGTETADQPGD